MKYTCPQPEPPPAFSLSVEFCDLLGFFYFISGINPAVRFHFLLLGAFGKASSLLSVPLQALSGDSESDPQLAQSAENFMLLSAGFAATFNNSLLPRGLEQGSSRHLSCLSLLKGQ